MPDFGKGKGRRLVSVILGECLLVLALTIPDWSGSPKRKELKLWGEEDVPVSIARLRARLAKIPDKVVIFLLATPSPRKRGRLRSGTRNREARRMFTGLGINVSGIGGVLTSIARSRASSCHWLPVTPLSTEFQAELISSRLQPLR